jgi:hypothetical protein
MERDSWLDMDQITEPVAVLRARNDPSVSFPPRGAAGCFYPHES